MNTGSAAPQLSPRLVLAAAGIAGASAMMTQLALLRELLGAFSGNELVLGLALGLWLLLTGAGARLGGLGTRSPAAGRRLAVALLVLAVVPLLQVAAVRGWRDHVFAPGAAVGLEGICAACTVLLAPYCLVSGAVFALAVGLLAADADRQGTGRVYASETLGAIAGGVLFTFALAPWLDHAALLCVPAVMNFAGVAVLGRGLGSPRLVSAGLAGSVLAAAVGITGRVDDVTTRWQYRERVVLRASSPYGRLVVTKGAGQLTFYENGAPVVFTENTGQTEESVLYALAACPSPRNVLLISGGVTGAAREALRAGARSVTVVELDPRMIEAGRRLLPENLSDLRIKMIAGDARRFVQRTEEQFDAIIVTLPDPATFQLNRYFTVEFLAAARRILRPGGVLGFGLGRYAEYIGPDLAGLLACAQRSAASVFRNVRLVPGGRVFFLASDSPLDADLAGRLEERGISGRLVNRHYLAAMLAPDRLADLARAVAGPADLNTDFAPVLCYHQMRHWVGQFALPATGVVLLVTAGLVIWLVRLPAPAQAVFAAGFAASTLELVLLLAVQALYGSLYRQLGVLITVFMAGLAGGAVMAARTDRLPPTNRMVAALAVAMAALAGLLPLLLLRLDWLVPAAPAGQAVLWLCAFALAVPVGAQFSVAAGLPGDAAAGRAARLYAADLTGAALGSLLASALLIPLMGVTRTCLLTAGLNIAAAAINWRMPART